MDVEAQFVTQAGQVHRLMGLVRDYANACEQYERLARRRRSDVGHGTDPSAEEEAEFQRCGAIWRQIEADIRTAIGMPERLFKRGPFPDESGMNEPHHQGQSLYTHDAATAERWKQLGAPVWELRSL